MKKRPKCKLINPDIAERGDCGYDFPSNTMQASYLTARERSRKGGVGAVGGVVAFLLIMRFAGLLQGAGRGAGPFIWALALLVLFIAAVTYWRKYSSRDDSD